MPVIHLPTSLSRKILPQPWPPVLFPWLTQRVICLKHRHQIGCTLEPTGEFWKIKFLTRCPRTITESLWSPQLGVLKGSCRDSAMHLSCKTTGLDHCCSNSNESNHMGLACFHFSKFGWSLKEQPFLLPVSLSLSGIHVCVDVSMEARGQPWVSFLQSCLHWFFFFLSSPLLVRSLPIR